MCDQAIYKLNREAEDITYTEVEGQRRSWGHASSMIVAPYINNYIYTKLLDLKYMSHLIAIPRMPF